MMSRLFLAIALLLQAASALKLTGAVTRRGAITSAAAAAVGIATPAFANSGELNAGALRCPPRLSCQCACPH